MKNETAKLPNSKESEMMILGCMLTSANALNIVSNTLDQHDFYYNEHQEIYKVLVSAHRNNQPGDIHLISEELKRQNKLELVGGVGYLTSLAQFAGTSAFIEEYINLVRAKGYARKAISCLTDLTQKLLSDPADPAVILEEYRQKITEMGRRYFQGEEAGSIRDILSGSQSTLTSAPFLKHLEEKHRYFKEHGHPLISGKSTGFRELDDKTLIMEDSNMIVIAARPALGKTSLALTVGNHFLENDLSVAIFSLEMTSGQLAERFISLISGIGGEKIKRGDISDVEFKHIAKCCEWLMTKNLIIQDRGCLSISKIVNSARRLKEKHNVSLIIVDYLQLIISEERGQSRQYEIAEISRQLKSLAVELKIPIICIAQLSRKVEDRQDHRPMLSDLRDSGQIEQDCDVALLIYRKDVYDKYDKPGVAELIVAKNRHGSMPTVPLQFHAPTGRFSDYIPLDKENGSDLPPQKGAKVASSFKSPPSNRWYQSDFTDD